ncbi:POK8 protein, partial [Psophia crepitans]|nr:POK8 protein [Psophia crepitans]
LLIIDLKDCFFTIPLHPEDSDRFAFTIPSVNRATPAERYQWVVLPQGMKNSPTICQWFVNLTLKPRRRRHPDMLTYHYMDDILIASQEPLTEVQEQKLVKFLQ